MLCRVQGTLDFEPAFCAIEAAHRPPLKWQTRMYERFMCGDVPGNCQLPTGLGKTSVIPIWLIALCAGAALPRRLVYIVNRRTVVDQATDVGAAMRGRLAWPDDDRWNAHQHTLRELAGRLRRLGECAPGDTPLAVGTLRGELADNGEWTKNPARPAIIVGTIDMIGSRLLFSGYGDGRYGRAHHAGLIGQDAMMIHDEAHLEPAFDALLESVKQEQERRKEARTIRVMRLSATTRHDGSSAGTASAAFGIEDEDRRDPVVAQRLSARKGLGIVEASREKVAQTIATQATELGRDRARVLVYVRSPDQAQKVRDAIIEQLKRKAKASGPALTDEAAAQRVGLLTGTIRGHERDELAESDLFKAFQSGTTASVNTALFLVSTSAGEVGVDWDADHLVCDLTTLDGMIQRFGRVNRLGGEGREARIVVVIEQSAAKKEAAEDSGDSGNDTKEVEPTRKAKKGPTAYERAVLKTGEIMGQIANQGGDASPAALGKVLSALKPKDRRAAFSPAPKILPATDILFDHWSLTSIGGDMPGRPPVAEYLHGVAEWEPPETHVAWRADIALLANVGGADDEGQPIPCSREDLAEVFEAFPLHTAETLRDRTDRVQEQLQALATRQSKAGSSAGKAQTVGGEPEAEIDAKTAPDDQDENRPVPPARIPADPWVVLMRGGSVEWVQLSEIAPADKDKAMRARRRLAFATVVLPVEAGGLSDGMLDGDSAAPEDPRTLDVAEALHDATPGRHRVIVKNGQESALLAVEATGGVARASVILATDGGEDAEPERIEYRVARGQDREPGERVPLGQHNRAVGEAAERIGRALGLSDGLTKALALAGRWHDAGKARVVWQRYATNPNGAAPIAKSDRYGHWKILGGYRHEFGSLLDAAASDEVKTFDPDTRDLALHLIAAHHGWARPHFEPRHFDRGDADRPVPTARSEAAAVEAMQRFGRLQRRYGRWGLAWLESLLRCADAEASGTPAREGGAR
ncbi:MAG: type I-U CRISPR-associated helicase/endonuclease Cas3 [Phycisphaerales bacterium]